MRRFARLSNFCAQGMRQRWRCSGQVCFSHISKVNRSSTRQTKPLGPCLLQLADPYVCRSHNTTRGKVLALILPQRYRHRHPADKRLEARRRGRTSPERPRIHEANSLILNLYTIGRLGCGQAGKLVGELGFTCGQFFGKFGRTHLGPLCARQYSDQGCEKMTAAFRNAMDFVH